MILVFQRQRQRDNCKLKDINDLCSEFQTSLATKEILSQEEEGDKEEEEEEERNKEQDGGGARL